MANSLNCANVPVDEAYDYALNQCDKDNKSLSSYFSNFKQNYLMLQNKCDLALDLPRIEMPVIEPEQMNEFQDSLAKGHIDIKEPVAKSPQSKVKYPTNLGFDLRGRQWLYRGTRDGAIEDDILETQMTEIAVADLKPSQSQIWLEKVIGMSLYFGPLKQSSEFLHEAPIIVSSDGYILDGHHRFGAAMISDPSLKLTALKVDMEIRELVEMARSYGNAIGNEQKAAESFEAESESYVCLETGKTYRLKKRMGQSRSSSWFSPPLPAGQGCFNCGSRKCIGLEEVPYKTFFWPKTKHTGLYGAESFNALNMDLDRNDCCELWVEKLYDDGRIGFGEASTLLASIDSGLKCSSLGSSNCSKENMGAESMVRKPAYGLFGLSFITGILLNMARKD